MAVAAAIPKKDYANRQYFLVQIDTLQNTTLLHDFIQSYEHVFRFEHAARAVDDHFVFSRPKDGEYGFLGNYRSNAGHLMRRDGHEAQYDALVNAPGVRSIHMLPEKRLEKRLPVYVQDAGQRRHPPGKHLDPLSLQEPLLPYSQEPLLPHPKPLDPYPQEPLNPYPEPLNPHLLHEKRLKIVDSLQQAQKEASERLQIEDPLFLEQWHLINLRYPGHDVNVKQLWYDGIRGKGVLVAIIDDGLDYESEDLADNFNAKGSWDFNENSALPKPLLFDDYHGTRCAGEVAAVRNNVCGLGVAYEAQVAGIRILSGPISSEDEAAAMVYGLEHNDIYLCLWGPADNGKTVSAPDALVKKAMVRGVQEGRQLKGAVYVFASGNGGRVNDQCNFDGYTNSIYSITVGAIDHKGFHPSYAETCSAVMVVTYSSGSGEHIHTTDFHKKCLAVHGGTSAAAPLAAGVYALVLQANPNLTWRDVQYVLAEAAVPVNQEDGDYQETAQGRLYLHKYGFGKIDAQALVAKAQLWQNVKPQAWHYGDLVTVNHKVVAPQDADSETISSSYTVSAQELQVMNLERLEHVTVTVNIQSLNRGKLDVRLVSPLGLVSKLAWYRQLDVAATGLKDWTFMSVVHWGEAGAGNWTLQVKSGPANTITLDNWQLRFFGECIDASKAEEFDLDTDYVKVRRERLEAQAPADSVSGSDLATNSEAATEPSASATPASSSEHQDSDPSAADTSLTSGQTALMSAPTALTSGQAALTSGKMTQTSGHTPAHTPGTDQDNKGDEPDEGVHEVVSADHSWRYFLVFAIAMAFIVFVYIARWQSDRTSSRRRRGDFEFDIIPNEDYSDTDDEHSFDLELPGDDRHERQALFDDSNDVALLDHENDPFQIGDEDDEAPKEPNTDT